MRNYWTTLLLFGLLSPACTFAQKTGFATVPFIGCPADGQQGPVAASLDVAGDMSLTRLVMRLPSDFESLTPILINYEETELRRPKTP
jgi:hypothetical protein